MLILDNRITVDELMHIEDNTFFDDMMKCVVDIKRGLVAANAELHADLETYLLDNGSAQDDLYGINILDDGEIEFDSLINPPRNRAAGFPRVGRYVADPVARAKIEEVVDRWIVR
ncbi:MAG: DUF5674 family protein [Lachnospiraceae bacterium]|nr:DUF5674 family protein [Lachnospiraceae bacterium]MCD8250256.1 DUF5674 family protein [Lachnospiraceae bacterium]